MKIATVGKGGSGKTTIAGLLARVLAGRNQHILALDGDPNPNLTLTLGMSGADADRITYIPADLMHRVGEQDGVSILKPSIPENEIMARFGHKAAENVDLLVWASPATARPAPACMCASHRPCAV